MLRDGMLYIYNPIQNKFEIGQSCRYAVTRQSRVGVLCPRPLGWMAGIRRTNAGQEQLRSLQRYDFADFLLRCW